MDNMADKKGQEEETPELSQDLIINQETNSIFLYSSITAELAAILSKAIKMLSVNGDITIYINSPGGDLDAAMSIINMMKMSKVKITTNVVGMAYSAAAIIFLAGNIRHMSSFSMLMFHSPTIGLEDNAAAVTKYSEVLSRQEKILYRYLLRDINLSTKEFKKKIEKDWFVSPKEALKINMAHKIY